MNPFKSIGHFFAGVGKLIGQGLHLAKDAGLTDEIIQIAIPYIKQASIKYIDNTNRREWVVAVLMARGLPESVARLATELAYRIYKAETTKRGL
mgnify:CR=1 FL=1